MVYENGKIAISINQKNTKCYVYLDIITSNTVLANLGQKSNGTVTDFSKTACDNGTNDTSHNKSGANCTSTDKGIYQAEDDYGTSYYYRGTVNNNWVKFAGFWWRIIRINGNGSIRMIYSGDAGTKPVDGRWVSEDNQNIGGEAYNSSEDDNTYMGYYTGTLDSTGHSTSYANAHNNSGGPSTIATVINNWYITSGLSNYSKYLDGSTGWCNDREIYSGTGYGTDATAYAAYNRLSMNAKPILTCTNKSRDLFTLKGNAGKGNGILPVPVGLITADEEVMAGAGINTTSNSGFWLYSGAQFYWTMTPSEAGSTGYIWLMMSDRIFPMRANMSAEMFGYRPVINLKAGTTLVNKGTGDKGTITNPYEVL